MSRQWELDRLNAAIAQGVGKIQYGDNSIEYRDLNDLYRIRDELEKEINGKSKTFKTTQIRFERE